MNCLSCLSEKDLLAVLALMLCRIRVGNANPVPFCNATALLNSPPVNDYMLLGKKQMLIALDSRLLQWGIDNDILESEDEFTESMKCMECLSEKQLLAIILNEIFQGISDGTIIPDPLPPM
jgi:hypothetical protein